MKSKKKSSGIINKINYSSYARYEKQKVEFAKKIKKIQSIPVKKMTKAKAQRMNKLVTEYIRRFKK